MPLCLHVGHGKTGSSALQSWLSLHSETLHSRHHIHYPQASPVSGAEETEARQLRFSMGNGFILHEIFACEDPHRHLRSLMPDPQPRDRLVFSREALMREIPDRLHQLADLAEAANLGPVQLLLFVRDPLEHAYSLYGQMVKAHGCDSAVAEWLPCYNLHEALERFLEAVADEERCELTVHNYSRNPAAIFQQLLEWLEVSDRAGPVPPALPAPVNRSLIEDELQVMRLLNRHLGRAAAPIGRRLVETAACPPAAPYRVPSQCQELFLDRLLATVQRINGRLPQSARLWLQRLPARLTAPDGQGPVSPESPVRLTLEQLAMIVEGLLPEPANL